MRCSTDEDRQQVDTQLSKCMTFCKMNDWEIEVAREYSSAWNKKRPIFEEKIKETLQGKYQVWVCFDLDRFSRDDPPIADKYLNTIVHEAKARFISINDSIDSSDDIKWNIVRHIMVWQANKYSQRLSNRIKEGINLYKKIEKKDSNTPLARKIKKLYNQDKINVQAIALQLGIPTREVHTVLGYHHGNRMKVNKEKIIELWKENKSISEIARELNCNKGSVFYILKLEKLKK